MRFPRQCNIAGKYWSGPAREMAQRLRRAREEKEQCPETDGGFRALLFLRVA